MLFTLHALAIFGIVVSVVTARPTFSGNFYLSNLFVSSPFQAHPNATSNSTVSFDFCDQDLPETAPIRCSIQWVVGVMPPTLARLRSCDEPGVDIWFPEGTYHGVRNFTMAITHTYADDTVGTFPYNQLTKYAEVNLTFPGTSNYECDVNEACCKSCDGTTIVAHVTRAIS